MTPQLPPSTKHWTSLTKSALLTRVSNFLSRLDLALLLHRWPAFTASVTFELYRSPSPQGVLEHSQVMLARLRGNAPPTHCTFRLLAPAITSLTHFRTKISECVLRTKASSSLSAQEKANTSLDTPSSAPSKRSRTGWRL